MNDSPDKKIIGGAAGWIWAHCGVAAIQQHVEPWNTQMNGELKLNRL